MKALREYPVFRVSKRCESKLKSGQPWVYDNEITDEPQEYENGCIADVLSEKGTYLGTGLVSDKSKIRIRILSRNANDRFDEGFWRRRVKYAIDHRVTVMGEDFSSCRLIFGEADGFPGVTADRYEDILSVQIMSYGMEQIKEIIYQALTDDLLSRGIKIRGIMERNDVNLRTLEGLEEGKGWYTGGGIPCPDDRENTRVEITENGIKYDVDVLNGQKTGFFLDQKYNRLAVSKIAKGRRVLDCFTHTGSFALNAAKGGAQQVTAVDVSALAIDYARENAVKNGLDDRMDFICEDVFELLPKLTMQKAGYDFIILDPPAFTKSRKTIASASRGYKEINYRAMKLLPRGGYLATCSCSHFMSRELFEKMLISAANDADVTLKLIESRAQAPDHPVIMGLDETDYLKFYLLQIV